MKHTATTMTMIAALASAMTLSAADVSVASHARSIIAEPGTISDVLWFAPLSGGLLKVGGTTNTAPFANLVFGGDGKILATGGRIELTGAETPRAPSASSPSCLSRAAIWLDAAQHVVTDGSGGVTRWYDVRETNVGGTWGASYWRGESQLGLETSSYPIVRQDANGRDVVYFNGCRSGTWMAFVNQPVSASDAASITGIRHLFLVFRVTAALGFPLGNSSGYPYFHSDMYSSNFDGSKYFFSFNNCLPTMTGGRRYLNGERCVPEYMHPVQNAEYVFEWENNGSPKSEVNVGNFFNDRGLASNTTYRRGGGDDIGEFIAFTNDLTAAARQQVSEYLTAKWGVARPKFGYSRSAATNVTIAVDVASGDFAGGAPLALAGGTVEKSGAGAIHLHEWYGDAPLPQIALKGGTVKDYGGMIPLDPQDGVAYSYANTRTLAAAATAAGSASFAGNAGYRVKAVSDAVRTLAVTADQLVLAGTDGETDNPVAAGAVEATIAGGNGNFESGGTGWTIPQNGTVGTLPNSSLWYTGWDYPAPEGTKALYIWANQNGFEPASCAVQIPVEGHYEMSFYTCARGRANDSYHGRVDIALLSAGGVTNWIGACNVSGAYGFMRNRFKTPWLEAGNYTLLLIDAYKRGAGTASSNQPFFDDFRLVRIPDAKKTFLVPNGNFEFAKYKKVYFRYYNDWSDAKYQERNTLEGWTPSDPDRVQPVCDNMLYLYRGDNSPYGHNQLAIFGGDSAWSPAPEPRSVTSASFKPGAGTWKLRMRGARWGSSEDTLKWAYVKMTASPSVSAVATVGGVDVSLGDVSFAGSDVKMREITFPNEFAVSGDDVEVSLKLTQTVANAAAIVDDLELVRQDEGELVSGGVFANNYSGTGWTFTTHKDTGVTAQAYASAGMMYFSQGWVVNNYGGAQCSGGQTAQVTQCGEMSQDITFTEPGTYRLVFWTRARSVDNTLSYAGNKVRAFLSSGSTTNMIGVTSYSLATNFVRQTFYFNVAAAGTWKFSLQGMNGLPLGDGTYMNVTPGDGFNANDSLVFIDGVSIRKAASLGPAPEGLDEKEVVLGAKTGLRLDYTGEARLKGLVLGGRRVVGNVDATHPSGLVFGPGSLYVVPRGTVILFK